MPVNKERQIYVWEKNHLDVCEKLNLFEGKDILEVGGCIPKSIAKSLKVKSWTCLDPWDGVNSDNGKYKILSEDIAKYNSPDCSYDLIFSTNAFEHIADLQTGLENMKHMLRPNGYLSALFGPIWSSSKGHHFWVCDNNQKAYTFNDDAIPKWGQLLYTESEMRELLSGKLPPEVVDALNIIYSKQMINHLFYEDYQNMINNLGLKILEFRNWHSPIIPDKETLKCLKEKYGDRNFSTISVKILLQKV